MASITEEMIELRQTLLRGKLVWMLRESTVQKWNIQVFP
jgi:hypothetical protein